MLKKILPILGAGAAYVGLSPLLAYADVTFNPCDPSNASGTELDKLCPKQNAAPSDLILRIIITILVIAAILALVFLIWGGIKWILSGGDKAKVETARNTIIAAIIGLIVAFLAFFILNIVLTLFGLNINSLSLPTIF